MRLTAGSLLAANLIHLPDELAGAWFFAPTPL